MELCVIMCNIVGVVRYMLVLRFVNFKVKKLFNLNLVKEYINGFIGRERSNNKWVFVFFKFLL